MSAREVMEWAAYEQVYGSLIVHERIDAGFAMVAMMLSDGNAEPRDFMPKWYQDLTAEAQAEGAMAFMRSMAGAASADD